jgi:hypothetical protein
MSVGGVTTDPKQNKQTIINQTERSFSIELFKIKKIEFFSRTIQ